MSPTWRGAAFVFEHALKDIKALHKPAPSAATTATKTPVEAPAGTPAAAAATKKEE
jgi:hypothetical protein